MDGARLWNAAAALRLPPSRIAAGVDSVSVCFSKGKFSCNMSLLNEMCDSFAKPQGP